MGSRFAAVRALARRAIARPSLLYPVLLTPIGVMYLVGLPVFNSGPVFNLIGASAVMAILLRARRLQGPARLPWILFAVGQGLFVSGDVIAYNYSRFFGRELPFPSVADGAYLAVYPALITGLFILLRRRSPGMDGPSLLDSLVVTISLGVLSWILLIAPYVHDATLSVTTKLISTAYPLMDVLLLAVVVRMAVGGGRRSSSFHLLAGGFAALLVTDSIYGWLLLHGGYEPGGLLDAGWIAFYLLLGTAALRPSAERLAERQRTADLALGGRRLGVLAAAALLVPTASGINYALGHTGDVLVTIGASAALFLLVLGRMAGLVRRHAETGRREHVLREAQAALVGAGDRESICEAAVSAVRAIAGPRTDARLELDRSAPVSPVSNGGALVVPLQVAGRGLGRMTVTSSRALAPSLAESIGDLAVDVALSLERAELSESLLRQESEARFGALVQNSSDAIAVIGLDARITYVTPSVARVLGHAPHELIGRSFLELVEQADVKRVHAFLVDLGGDSDAPGRMELRMNHADGRLLDVETVRTNMLSDPRIGGIVLTTRDISERKAFEQELAHQAFHDSLTGLANRALFRDRLEHALNRRRHNRIAVLFLDLDDFKTINDSLGHLAADRVLHEVGERIRGCLRPSDTAARLGGDEFGVLLEDLETADAAAEGATRVLEVLRRPFSIEGVELTIHASLGVAPGASPGEEPIDAEALLRNADLAMYVAKAQGKRRFELFDPSMHEAVVERLELKADLRRAVDQREFVLHYQPIVRIGSGEVLGLEALVRWQHPTRGLVAPGDFIPLAEENGLIVPIGRWVLEEACGFMARLHARRPSATPLSVTVNLSARQLHVETLTAEVANALRSSGLVPASLVLEITESAMMEDIDLSIERMHELKRLGVRLAVDDFGSGYSSLNYIQRFPIDIVKLDRSFLSNADDGGISEMTQTILELAGIMKLTAVAEGIETTDQADRLVELGCDIGQGFLFALPTPADGIDRLLGPLPRPALAA